MNQEISEWYGVGRIPRSFIVKYLYGKPNALRPMLFVWTASHWADSTPGVGQYGAKEEMTSCRLWQMFPSRCCRRCLAVKAIKNLLKAIEGWKGISREDQVFRTQFCTFEGWFRSSKLVNLQFQHLAEILRSHGTLAPWECREIESQRRSKWRACSKRPNRGPLEGSVTIDVDSMEWD